MRWVGTIAGGEGMESNVIEILNMQQREKAALHAINRTWTLPQKASNVVYSHKMTDLVTVLSDKIS